MYVVMIYFRL